MRTLPVFTIDSISTVEIDDGLSIQYRGPNKQEWVLIHIADPTRWLLPNTALDLCARKRASTVYLPELVQAMLPLEMARDLMSILPSHRSHALTFAVRLSPQGDILESEIFPSLLQNITRTNYDAVDAVLNHKALALDGPDSLKPLPESYDLLVEPTLHRLYELSLLRRSWRKRQGALITNLPKAKPILSEGGAHVDVLFDCASDSKAQILVSEMMILTGQVAAKYATENNIPVPFRTQDPPLVESEEYSAFLRTLPPIVREFEYISIANRAKVTPPSIPPLLLPSPHAFLGQCNAKATC